MLTSKKPNIEKPVDNYKPADKPVDNYKSVDTNREKPIEMSSMMRDRTNDTHSEYNRQKMFTNNQTQLTTQKREINEISEMIKSEKIKSERPQTVTNNKNIVFNVINPDDPSTIMVTFNNNTFTFYDNKKSHLGFFTIEQLLKYITKDQEFLSNVGTGTSDAVIETFICKTHDGKVRIYDHISSIFMGNLEMLVKLNNALFQYEKKLENNHELSNKKNLLKNQGF